MLNLTGLNVISLLVQCEISFKGWFNELCERVMDIYANQKKILASSCIHDDGSFWLAYSIKSGISSCSLHIYAVLNDIYFRYLRLLP